VEGFLEIPPAIAAHPDLPSRCARAMWPRRTGAIAGLWTMGLYRCEACARHYGGLTLQSRVLSPCYLCVEDATVVRRGRTGLVCQSHAGRLESETRNAGDHRRRVVKPTRRICLVNALGNCWGDAIATIANSMPWLLPRKRMTSGRRAHDAQSRSLPPLSSRKRGWSTAALTPIR